MKSIYQIIKLKINLLICSLIFSLFCFSCSDNKKFSDENIPPVPLRNFSNDEFKRYNVLNSDSASIKNNRIKKITKYSLDKGIYSLVFIKEFNSDGFLIKKIVYNTNTACIIEEYKYDNKRCIEYSFVNKILAVNDVYLKEPYKYKYNYDKFGKIISVQIYKTENSRVEESKSVYRYDQYGDLIEIIDENAKVTFKWENNKLKQKVVLSNSLFFYDTSSIDNYVYTDNGHMIHEEKKKLCDKIIYYDYDSLNYLSKTTTVNSNGETLIFENTKIKYFPEYYEIYINLEKHDLGSPNKLVDRFDYKNNWLSTYGYENDKLLNSYKAFYMNNHLIKEITIDNIPNNQSTITTNYFYDSFGRLSEKIDSDSYGKETKYYKIIYNKSGCFDEEIFSRANDSKWIYNYEYF